MSPVHEAERRIDGEILEGVKTFSGENLEQVQNLFETAKRSRE